MASSYSGSITGTIGTYNATGPGGMGGAGLTLSRSSTLTATAKITGGSGAAGGKQVVNGHTQSAAGGTGGFGVYIPPAISLPQIVSIYGYNYGYLAGGSGGDSYYAGYSSSGGGGGTGGTGAGGGSGISGTIRNLGTIVGGSGGNGARAGGTGGDGISLSGTIAIANKGLIRGGKGGTSINYGITASGGIGAVLSGADHLINSGTIAGYDNFALRISGASQITNQAGGLIDSTDGAGGTVSLASLNETFSVYLTTGAAGATLDNSGTIIGALGAFSTLALNNAALGTISGSIYGEAGGTITNAGSIGAGVRLADFGLLDNSGAINGFVAFSGPATGSSTGLTLDNTGVITGTAYVTGNALNALIDNGAGATLGSASDSASVDDGVGVNLSLTNAGTLIGRVKVQGAPSIVNHGVIAESTYYVADVRRTFTGGGIYIGNNTASGTAALVLNYGSIAGGIGIISTAPSITGAPLIDNAAGGTIVASTIIGATTYGFGTGNYLSNPSGISLTDLSITSTASPVTLVSNAGLIKASAYGDGVKITSNFGTLANSGTIIGGSNSYDGGVVEASGNYTLAVVNETSGLIEGGNLDTPAKYGTLSAGYGVRAASVTNEGTILGGSAGSGSTYSGGIGVWNPNYLLNSGLIEGGAGGGQISTKYVGGTTGTETLGIGGIAIDNAFNVTNTGTIIGGAGADGVVLGGASGTVATLINDGIIIGGASGTSFGAGLAVAEGARSSGISEGGADLINAGTIAAGSSAGIAISLGQYDGLSLMPGSTILGTVSYSPFGGTYRYVRAALSLLSGSSQGTITGIGETITPFETISFVTGATWLLEGAVTGLTSTDDVFPPTGAITIAGFAQGDTIVLDSFATAGDSYVSGAGLELNRGASTVTLGITGSFTTSSFDVTTTDGDTWITLNEVACFSPGTLIRTARGEVRVEELVIGDRVATAFGGSRPVKWIGHRHYAGRFVAGNRLVLPVRFAANAIADGVPARDLIVSPGHGMFVDGALVPAWRLINGVSITQPQQAERIEYYHVELDEHDIIFADDCPSESFYGEPFRMQFQNAAEFYALYPDATPATELMPRTEDGFVLDAIQRRLAARAGIPAQKPVPGALRGYVDQAGPNLVCGWAQDEAAVEQPICLDILVDGRRIARVLANRYRADLREAGLGSGCHAFELTLPEHVTGPVEVRRAADGRSLALTGTAANALAA